MTRRGKFAEVEDIDRFEGFLHSLGIPTKRQTVKEDSVEIGQIFFHDPDGNMIEVCNCDRLPIVPLSSNRMEAASLQEALSCHYTSEYGRSSFTSDMPESESMVL